MTSIDTELRALANAPTGMSFVVLHGPHRVGVDFNTDNDDEVTSLALSVPYDRAARAVPRSYREHAELRGPRPMAITMHPETAADQMARDEGVSVEWQSGDARFDEAVYVDSPVSDPAILSRVLDAEVRAGVLALLALGFSVVEIDDAHGLVVARLPKRAFAPEGVEAPGQRALDAFEQVFTNLPAVTATAAAVTRRPLWRAANLVLTLVGGAGWLVNVGYVGALGALVSHLRGHEITYTPLMAVGPVFFGLVVGALGGSAWRRLAERLARGSSNAHKQGARAVWVGFAGFSVLAFSVAFVLVGLRYGQAAP